jgi:glycosyltransferase involved in cell wall biosynthesis
VVLVAQRLWPEKDTDVAIRAFSASGLASEGWRLVVAGDGALRRELETLAGSLGIGASTDFLGHRSDVLDLMRTSGLLLAPGPAEAFGLSVMDAMARALPVVAAGAGAHLETVGLAPDAALFPPGDAERAGSLLRALALSASARDAYGAQLQDLQRTRFTVVEQARRTEQVYREVL